MTDKKPTEKKTADKKDPAAVNKSEEIRKVARGMKDKGQKPRPVTIIAMLKKQGIPQHWSKEATSMAMKKGAVTLWSIVDALTQLAGKIPNAGERTQLDQQAGALLSVAV